MKLKERLKKLARENADKVEKPKKKYSDDMARELTKHKGDC